MNSLETSRISMNPPRVCVLFPGALGDLICFLPALYELAKSYAVDLLACSDFAAIAPQGVRVLSLERFEVRQLFIGDGARDERVSQFFAAYAAIYTWFASQQRVFVDQLQTVSQGRAQIFPFRPDQLPGHQADYYLSCLNREAQQDFAPLVSLRAEARLWCDAFCQRVGLGHQPLLLVAPGSGAREKNWPEARFLQVVHWWRDRIGGRAVVVVGPVELERHGYAELSSACVVASALDLGQLAALLARGDLYIGNDSGVSHLAAAVGCRTVALFGPSDDRQWAPRGPRVTILRHTLEATPSGGAPLHFCPDRAGLADLTTAAVIHELSKLPEVATRWQRSP
jgi:ADP-heptose:LPS heptosyltransferase